jgi:hypothetical protein
MPNKTKAHGLAFYILIRCIVASLYQGRSLITQSLHMPPHLEQHYVTAVVYRKYVRMHPNVYLDPWP